MLGSEIEACKLIQNDLKSGQRHRHDLSVWRWVLGCPSKTKKWGQTPDPKCKKIDLYGEMACTKSGDFISPASERPKTSIFFQGVRSLPMPSLKKSGRLGPFGSPRNKFPLFGTGHFPIQIHYSALWLEGLTSFFVLRRTTEYPASYRKVMPMMLATF